MFEILERFSLWCRQKVEMHVSKKDPPLFKQGEVWWCSIGMNVGEELFGKGDRFARPVVVLKKFSRNTFLAVPLTQRENVGTYFIETRLGDVSRWAILCQVRTIDSKRLLENIGTLDKITLKKIRNQFCRLIVS